MKPLVSIKLQRIFLFIPFVNALLLFIWLFFCLKYKIKQNEFLKVLFSLFGILFLFVIPLIFLNKLFGANNLIVQILSYSTIYTLPFAIGCRLINYQKNLLEES